MSEQPVLYAISMRERPLYTQNGGTGRLAAGDGITTYMLNPATRELYLSTGTRIGTTAADPRDLLRRRQAALTEREEAIERASRPVAADFTPEELTRVIRAHAGIAQELAEEVEPISLEYVDLRGRVQTLPGSFRALEPTYRAATVGRDGYYSQFGVTAAGHGEIAY